MSHADTATSPTLETGLDVRPGDVTIVVVNYNAGRLLERCLDSVQAHGGPDVGRTVVIDNASTDGSAAYAADRAGVTLIANKVNTGFAAANNVALRDIRTPYVLLLNPDAELTHGCLRTLLTVLRQRPRCAAVGPRLVYTDGRLQRWTAGREPSIATLAAYALGVDRYVANDRQPAGLYLGRDVDVPISPDWISGACLLLRTAALQEVGLLDESFFCYMEDVDLCRRLRQHGWEVAYDPRATCVHALGGSGGTSPVAAHDESVRNLLRYHARQHGTLARFTFRATATACFGARAIAHATLASLRRGDQHHQTAARTHLRHARTSARGDYVTAVNEHLHAHAGGVSVHDRHQHELDTYNERARELWANVSDDELLVDVSEPPFPNRAHRDFLRYALASLGDLAGKRILEVGCGNGTLATYLALRGAQVTALDISTEMVKVTQRRARVNGVADSCTALTQAIEEHEAETNAYDLVIGNQVLHHVVLDVAMPNIRRMLAPGGRVAFCEPVLMLPEFTRRVRNSRAVTAFFPMVTDSPDERSLGRRELDVIGAAFDYATERSFQITTRLENFFTLSDRAFSRLHKLDRALLAALPATRRLCRYVVVVAGRGVAPGRETTDSKGAAS